MSSKDQTIHTLIDTPSQSTLQTSASIPDSLKFESKDGVRHAWKPVLVADVKDVSSGYYRGPMITVLPNGKLVCSLLTGGTSEPQEDNYLAFVASDDQGDTWSKPKVFFQSDKRRCVTGSFIKTKDRVGVIMETAVHGSYNLEQRAWISWYHPDKDQWEVPYAIPGFPNVHTFTPTTTPDGTLLIPVFWAEGSNQICPGDIGGTSLGMRSDWGELIQVQPKEYRHVCGVIATSDGGKTFRHAGYVSLPNITLWEPTIAVISAKHWVMLMRAEGTGFLYRSETHDAGATWSTAEATDILNPSTKPFFMQIGDAILLFHNPNPGVGFYYRNQIELWISKDGLKTWEAKIPLTHSGTSGRPTCYPDGIYLPETHEIALVIDTGRNVHLQRIPCKEIGL